MRAVLFDLDGTVTDPGIGITNSVMYAVRKFGIEPPPREELYCFIGPPLRESFSKYFGLSAEQAEKAKTQQVAAAGGATKTAATAASYDDVTLLAALIQCESGSQPYEGQVAVGNVVMNRLHSGAYGGSLSSVIYAPGQFTPAATGAVARVAAAGPSATAMAAAQAALNGENYIGSCTQFRNIACGHPGTVIGAHVFW